MTADAPLKLAVFDMDGTLIDSQTLIQAAMARGFAETGLPAPGEAQVLSIVGLSLPEAMRVLAPGAAAAEIARLVAAYKTAFVALRAQMGGEAGAPMYPGARAALERLKADLGLADETIAFFEALAQTALPLARRVRPEAEAALVFDALCGVRSVIVAASARMPADDPAVLDGIRAQCRERGRVVMATLLRAA